MTGRAPLPPTRTTGAYTVRSPRRTDTIAESLRSAYVVEGLPEDWQAALRTLDRH